MNFSGRPPTPKLDRSATSLRAFAEDQLCTLRIPGFCRHDPKFTVGCHIRLFGAGGMGQKPHDIFMVHACDRCHSVLDDRSRWAGAQVGFEDVLRALIETQTRLLIAGKIEVIG